MALVILGALLIILGVVVAAVRTARRGRLSDPEPHGPQSPSDTLEPAGKGRRLSLAADLPGIGLVALGVILLLIASMTRSTG